MESNVIYKIASCKDFLRSLNGTIITETIVISWFQDLCNKISDLLLDIVQSVRQRHKPIENVAKERMLLFLLQLSNSISVLIKIFLSEYEANVIITAGRYCTVKQIGSCLDGLEDVLIHPSLQEEPEGFMKYVDASLDRIMEIDVELDKDIALRIFANARDIVDEILCHAMTIAQISIEYDGSSIKGTCKQVLDDMSTLLQYINQTNPNIAMCNLFIEATCDKICDLERKVNRAVLKLCLKVFSICTQPLDQLHRYSVQREERDNADFDAHVLIFDNHIDRIFQVGMFAASCAPDPNCALKIRSCLASLEALEGELVPSMAALYNEDTTHNLQYANILKSFWIQQTLMLKKFIYHIIDPFAFCQVTYEVIKQINDDLEDCFQSATKVDKDLIKPITVQTKILYEMLIVGLNECPAEDQETVQRYLNDVIKVTIEIDAAADMLLADGAAISKQNAFRVFKRCKVQENLLKKLLATLGAQNLIESDDEDEKKYSNDTEECLKSIAKRGKEMIKERSILYNLDKTEPIVNIAKGRGTPMRLAQLVHLRNLHFSRTQISNQNLSIDLQISDILNNLSSVCDSIIP